jgi:hypothetical protein
MLKVSAPGVVSHEVGTMRIGEQPQDAVVDTDLRIHGLANAYVCDLSVFPTSPASNPSLTLAALALRLAEQGRLGLDDPIIRWYPAWRGDRSATVRDLLGHTAGTTDPTDAAMARLLRGGPFTVRAFIGAAPRPGARTTQAKYSDVGFVIAGIVLARPPANRWHRRCAGACSTCPAAPGLRSSPASDPTLHLCTTTTTTRI